MSNYTAIGDLSNTVLKLLQNNIKEIPADNITLGIPEESSTAKVSLYLYRVEENAYLKNQESSGYSDSILSTPLVLDLYYLLTVYLNGASESSQVSDMHVVLGRAMQTLHDNAVLKGSILQGGLKSSNCEFRITQNPISFEELTKILTAFPDNTQKVSTAYIVSPVFIDSARSSTVTRTYSIEKVYGSKPEDDYEDSTR